MSVTTTTASITYTGNSVTTAFPFTFKVFASTDLVISKYTIATAVTTVLTDGADYSVVLNNGGVNGGTVTILTGAPSAAYRIIIQRLMDITQLTDYVENDPFSAESHEDALDKLTMICQQLNESLASSTGSTVVVGDPTITLTNGSGGTLTAGMAVYVSAANTVNLADATDTTKQCIAMCTGVTGANALLKTAGFLADVPVVGTNVTAGDRLFLSTTPGSLTIDVPSASGNIVQFIGFAVTNEAASTVSILININPTPQEV